MSFANREGRDAVSLEPVVEGITSKCEKGHGSWSYFSLYCYDSVRLTVTQSTISGVRTSILLSP